MMMMMMMMMMTERLAIKSGRISIFGMHELADLVDCLFVCSACSAGFCSLCREVSESFAQPVGSAARVPQPGRIDAAYEVAGLSGRWPAELLAKEGLLADESNVSQTFVEVLQNGC